MSKVVGIDTDDGMYSSVEIDAIEGISSKSVSLALFGTVESIILENCLLFLSSI